MYLIILWLHQPAPWITLLFPHNWIKPQLLPGCRIDSNSTIIHKENKDYIKNLTLKNSLSGVSLWAWGLGTASQICSITKIAQHTEKKTKKHQAQQIIKWIPSECLPLE
jgi:hypothetical protein